jgi:ADP-ribose pyrophosphatase YjhB (NUDIX family)
MNFCSQCGGPVLLTVPDEDDRPRYVCPSCGTIHYQNPKLVVGCIPVWEDRILMCRRNIEPRKGFWTLPAGFLENGETTAEGARRETLEETGSTVAGLTPYLMVDIVHIHQIYLMFRSRLLAAGLSPDPGKFRGEAAGRGRDPLGRHRIQGNRQNPAALPAGPP